MSASDHAIRPESALSPVSAAKREAIVCAAARVFMASGYGAASMDQIANAAGVSKQTVYSHFGAKQALFEEIVKQKCDELMAGGVFPGREGTPEAVLTETAARFLDMINGAETMTLYRMILAESGRFPELAEAFYRSGPSVAVRQLAGYLERVAKTGALAIEDPMRAAETFFALLRDDLYLRRILDLSGPPDAAETTARAARAARAFMRIYGVR